MAYPKYNIFPAFNITTNGNYTVLPAQGALHAITVNKPGSSWVAVLYDGLDLTGKILGTINFISTMNFLIYDIEITKGLFIQCTGSSAGDITVSAG
jgi:hypothetical protein